MAPVDLKNFASLGKKIVGAGLNYKSIVKAKGLKLPDKPVIFLKPSSSYIVEGQNIQFPKEFEVHHEVELGVIIGKTCRNIKVGEVKDFIAGYCVALDLTAVDQMTIARTTGLPWSIGKGFDTACPVGPAIPKEKLPNPSDARLKCLVNGQLRQDCSTADMIFSTEELIAFVSQFMTLEPYDLILTGSPAGTGPICPGDTIEVSLDNQPSVKFTVS